MTIYNLYIFDRQGTCLYYGEWVRTKESDISRDEEYKLLYGMLFSIKSFSTRLSPFDQKEGFQSLSTSKYKMNFYETASGLKILLNTDPSVGNIQDILHEIYSSIYVEYVVKNALCPTDQPIVSELFKSKLDDYIRGLPIYATKVAS